MIQFTLDGKTVEYKEGLTILEAAKNEGIRIPTLCSNEHLKPYGGCRLCLVEISMEKTPEQKKITTSCCTAISPGLVVRTDTAEVLEARRFILELLLSRCPESPELQKLSSEIGIDRENLDNLGEYLLNRAERPVDTNCILCGLCVRVCAEVTERHALCFSSRGMSRKIETPFRKYAESCIGCKSCAYVCPTNTITVEEVE